MIGKVYFASNWKNIERKVSYVMKILNARIRCLSVAFFIVVSFGIVSGSTSYSQETKYVYWNGIEFNVPIKFKIVKHDDGDLISFADMESKFGVVTITNQKIVHFDKAMKYFCKNSGADFKKENFKEKKYGRFFAKVNYCDKAGSDNLEFILFDFQGIALSGMFRGNSGSFHIFEPILESIQVVK